MGAIWCLWILSGKHAGGKVRLQKYDTGRGFIPFIIILVLVLVAGPAAYLMPKNAGSLQPIVDGGYAGAGGDQCKPRISAVLQHRRRDPFVYPENAAGIIL